MLDLDQPAAKVGCERWLVNLQLWAKEIKETGRLPRIKNITVAEGGDAS